MESLKGQRIELFHITDDLQTISEYSFAHTVELGSDKKYGIWWDDVPCVLIEVDRAWNPFDDACVFGNRVYVGNNDKLIIVDLDTLDCKTVACDGKTIKVCCCMDPCPAVWCDKIVSVESGEVLYVGEVERFV